MPGAQEAWQNCRQTDPTTDAIEIDERTREILITIRTGFTQRIV
jgi:hypothetical protein